MPRTPPAPWEPTDVPHSGLPLWSPEHWPGAPQPVLVLAEDSLAALAAARWAARSARHNGTDVALAVMVPAGSGAGSTKHLDDAMHLDDARATAARLLPTTHAYGVHAHAVLLPVAHRATAHAAARAEVRAFARAAEALDAPLLVLAAAPDAARTRQLCAMIRRDVLVVPPRSDCRPPART